MLNELITSLNIARVRAHIELLLLLFSHFCRTIRCVAPAPCTFSFSEIKCEAAIKVSQDPIVIQSIQFTSVFIEHDENTKFNSKFARLKCFTTQDLTTTESHFISNYLEVVHGFSFSRDRERERICIWLHSKEAKASIIINLSISFQKGDIKPSTQSPWSSVGFRYVSCSAWQKNCFFLGSILHAIQKKISVHHSNNAGIYFQLEFEARKHSENHQIYANMVKNSMLLYIYAGFES